MPRILYLSPLLALTACLLLANSTDAQESTTRGLTLGVHASGASLTVESGDRSDAGGGGIRLGYGLNRNFTLFLQLDGAQFDVNQSDGIEGQWTMGHVDLGTRFHFANSLRSWVPYLQAAFTGRAVEVKNPTVNGNSVSDVRFNGGAFSVGGGLMAYFMETLALDVQLSWSKGEFTQVDVGPISSGRWTSMRSRPVSV